MRPPTIPGSPLSTIFTANAASWCKVPGVRALASLLLSLLVLIQYPLWLGKGGWFRAWEIETELQAQRVVNDQRRMRNAALEAQVRDLRTGSDAVEEIARAELGMLKKGEIFVQISERSRGESASPAFEAEVRTASFSRRP